MPKPSQSPEPPPSRDSGNGQSAAFPIVGIGASAGGLEALRGMLQALPNETGMAFVILQHLAPDHISTLAEILTRSTGMPVCEVRDEPVVEPNHVYVIPPARDMIISGGKLVLLPRKRGTLHRGIDQFFRSLADHSGHQAIGVVLSGGASDGTLGLQAIKAAGGVTFAQDDSARHDSMPKSAVASGCVDFVLPPEGIAAEIARIARHPYVAPPNARELNDGDEPWHGRVTGILRRATGVDFTHYKAAPLERRIERRMMVHRIETLAEYEQFLQATPGEVEALYQDVLINVTSFFRNAAAFEVLEKRIFPRILSGRGPPEPVRIWTLGCSTGEEAYSLAILFAECAEKMQCTATFQMFASDLNASCIERARAGHYPRSIAAEVSPERLRKYFVEEDGGYRVNKSIRERVVFSRHNVLADPPFSRVDFISCRNLLIYMEPVLQQQVLALLHYALKPGGHLLLGSSESLGASSALFDVEDSRQKIFVRRPGPALPRPRVRSEQGRPFFPPPLPETREPPAALLHREAERVLLAKYVPPGVVVNSRLEVVHFRGDTGAYLAPATGMASHGLLKMLRPGLLVPVRTALARVERENSPAREEGARVKCFGGYRQLAVEVIPLKANTSREAGYIVLFDESSVGTAPSPATSPARKAVPEDEGEIARLTQELATTREFLQSVIEEQDAANEELQSLNEETQSANEEMQSVNEELETSKEEIQSSNEELATVNDELNHRNLELADLSNDLTNILSSTRLAILIVTRDLRLRRFTPVAEKTFNLASGDLGRALADIKLSLTIPDLEPLLREVVATGNPCEREVQESGGRWYLLRARPYLTHHNKMEGAVVTLIDVDKMHRAQAFADDLLAHAPVPVLVLDSQLRVKTASRAFYATFESSPASTVGRSIYELGEREWDIPKLRTLLGEVLPQAGVVGDFEVSYHFPKSGPRILRLNASRLAQAADNEPLIVLTIEDITERRREAEALRESEARKQAILDSALDAIITMDHEGRLLEFNPGAEKIFGHARADVIGHQLADLMIPGGLEQYLGRDSGPLLNEVIEMPALRADGTEFPAEFAIVPIPDAQPPVFTAFLRDVTVRRQLEESLVSRAEELARAARAKDEFLAMLAHELRNPLAPLRNAAELLKIPGVSGEEHAEAHRILGRSIENMSRLIDDLLDVSRITEGKIQLRREPVSLAAVLTAAAAQVRCSCAAHRQELTLTLPPEPVFLMADATRLEQVFGNLLGNACKYAGDGCHITLSAERGEGEVLVRVADDGAGIDPEVLPRIFDLFVQASRTLDRTHGGLGIGLTLVQRLVRLHGGSITAHSDGLGHGAEFLIRLPILEAPPPPAAPPPPVTRERPRRILVVDDNADSARSLAALQARRGHQTRTAFTGPEAVAVAAEFLPEVVLLDIGLPGMDGFAVARQLRALPALQGVFIIAMSGYGHGQDRARATAAGFDQYMVKPLDLAQLQKWLAGLGTAP